MAKRPPAGGTRRTAPGAPGVPANAGQASPKGRAASKPAVEAAKPAARKLKKAKEPKLKPSPGDPLDVLKFELAEEMGLLEKVKREGWGGLSAAESGRLGGMMTRRRIERGELVPGQPAPPRRPPGDNSPAKPEEEPRAASKNTERRGTV